MNFLLYNYENRGLVKGVRIATTSPVLTHLFFADDSLIFFRANADVCSQVKACLHAYEKASGQLINYEKSALSFSPNTGSDLIEKIKTELTIPVVQGHDMYLGLPTFSLRSRRIQFQYLVERLSCRINGWGSKLFSAGGKETLIKSVIQAIPTFAMSCFRIPIATIKSIEKECAKFWWGTTSNRRKMHWKSWDFLCQPKYTGGMGFRKMDVFNKALIAKQLWRIIQNPFSLVAKVLKGRYFKYTDIMDASLGSNPSYIWRSLIWGRELLDRGLCWRIGDGSTVDIFRDRWIPTRHSKLGAECIRLPVGSKVSTLICSRKWNEQKVRQVCLPYIANEILSIPIPLNIESNKLFWKFDPKGHYSVKDGYKAELGVFDTPVHQSNNQMEQSRWRYMWSLHIPPKIRVFWWRACHNILPTAVNLRRHHLPVAHGCSLCQTSEDTTMHALFWCSVVRSGWKSNIVWNSLKIYKPRDLLEISYWMIENASRKDVEEFICQAWLIWSERCRILHSTEDTLWRFQMRSKSEYIEEYRKSMKEDLISKNHPLSVSPVRWIAPSEGHLRMDVDVSFSVANEYCGIGGVIRNHEGQLVAAFGRLLQNPGSVIMGELLAIKEGLMYVKERGFHHVIVSSDSLLAVQAVTKPVDDLSYVDTCALDIHELQKDLGIASLFHVKRSANEVAHFIAKFSCSSPAPFSWELGNFPAWLVSLVMNDLNFME